MKQVLKPSLLVVLGLCLLTQADAQKTKTKSKTEKTKEEVPPPPPPKEMPPNVEMTRIDTAGGNLTLNNDLDFDTSAVPEDELTAEIRKYLEITNSLETGYKVIKNLYESEDMKTLLPEDFRTKFIEAYSKDGLARRYIERINIRAIRKQLTLQDVRDLNAFYQTPVGKKMASVTPLILMETTSEGSKLGKWIATQLY